MEGIVDEHSEESKATADLIEAGSGITGALAGAAIGALGGPAGMAAGAIAGPALATAIKRVGLEFRARHLGPRSNARVGAVFAFAVQAVQERLDRGDRARADGFFERQVDGRSKADEIIEAVCLAAERDYEEAKLPLYGRLLSALAFRVDISRADANYLIREANSLSLRQLHLLALACRDAITVPELNGIPSEDARGAEAVDLANRRLIRREPDDADRWVAWSNGRLLGELMELDRLTDREIAAVVAIAMSRATSDTAEATDTISVSLRRDT
jgi:hypothetical protein